MRNHTELPFVDEFRWVSPLRYLKNGWQNAVLLWCMLQAGPPFLHYYCAVVLRSCIVLPPVGHSSKHEYHCFQLTRQSSCVSNFYRTSRVFIRLSLVLYCSCMFRHYCVILRELVVSTLLSYTTMSMQSLVIQFKFSHMFYAVESQRLKSLKY